MKEQLYFGRNDEICSTLDSIIEDMHDDDLTQLAVSEADIEKGTGFFWCSYFYEVTEKYEDTCGRQCKGYAPINGVKGKCKRNHNVYSQGKEFLLVLSKKGSYEHTLIEK